MADLYRYFSLNSEPFGQRRVFENELDFLDTFPESTYDSGYSRMRARTEDVIREKFLSKGGRPELNHPYYMVVGNCDRWFKGVKGFRASLSIPLENFDPSIISFTYGDSIPVLNGMVEGECSGQVYTLDEIREVINRLGMPQNRNLECENGTECYIEVQVWSEKPLERFMSRFAEHDLIFHVESVVDATMSANLELRDIKDVPQWGVADIFSLMRAHPDCDVFMNKIGSLNASLYEDNHIHGIIHAFRCTIYCIALCLMRGYSMNKILLAIDAVSNHDVGRTVDAANHGRIGADLFRDFHPFYDERSMRVVMAAIHAHQFKEEDVGGILTGYDVGEDMSLVREIAELVRDCDALDYVRLGVDGYDPKFVKGRDSKGLVRFAMCLNLMTWRYPRQSLELFRRILDD